MKLAKTNGIEIAYDERGEGEPLILAAGIGMQLIMWPDGFLDRLAARGLRVIVFDNRDIGKSTRLSSAGVPKVPRLIMRVLFGLPVTAPYSLYDMASDVAGLIDFLGLGRAHLAGVSLGGMIAQATAIKHSHRLKSVCSLMSHPNGRLLGISKPGAMRKLLMKAPRNREEAAQRQVEFFRYVGSTGFRRDDAMVAEAAAAAYDRGAHPAGFARHFAAMAATGDMRPPLRNVRLPTLVMHGSDDPLIRASFGKDTAKAIPNAEFRLIQGWGHDLPPGAWDLLANAVADHVLRNAKS